MRNPLVIFAAFAFLVIFNVGAVAGDAIPGAVESQTVIDNQIKAFRAQDHDQAFGYAAPGIRQMFKTTDNFIGMVKGGYDQIYRASGWSFGRTKTEGGILFQEVLVTGPDGREWMAIYSMKQQPDGSWKIAGVQIVPGAGRTT